MACLASSPGRMRRTLVWISREDIVDFLEYAASSKYTSFQNVFDFEENERRTRCLTRNPLKYIVYERIQNRHCLVRDTSVRVHLLQHCIHNKSHRQRRKTTAPTLVDVGAVSLLASLLSLLLFALWRLSLARSFLCGPLGGLLRSLLSGDRRWRFASSRRRLRYFVNKWQRASVIDSVYFRSHRGI